MARDDALVALGDADEETAIALRVSLRSVASASARATAQIA
jgi:hypothetical protein